MLLQIEIQKLGQNLCACADIGIYIPIFAGIVMYI